jgi:hypothetical protein
MANMEAALNRQQESFRAAAAEMMRENREFFGRIAAQQGLTAAQVQEMLERRLADVQPTVVQPTVLQPTVVDARTVNIDARSVDARTVNKDSRTVVIHQVDNRSVAQVVNVSGGPPPPPPPGAGAIRNGPAGPLPNHRWTPYAKAPAVADQLAITAGPPPPPPPPSPPAVPSVAARAKSAPQGRALVDLPARTRTRSPRARASATKEAREAARQAKAAEKERERAAKAAERERRKELKKIAREALVQDARRKQPQQQKRPQVFDISGQDTPAPRVPDQWLEPEEAAAAAEAAVKRRKGVRPKAKATSQPRAKAQPKAQSKSPGPAIRRVPVERERSPKRAGPKRAPRRARSAVGQVAGAENIQAQ